MPVPQSRKTTADVKEAMARSRSEYVVLAIALLGMILSGYALTLHYGPSGEHFCELGGAFSCDKVNKSPWSVFLGVPVAALGLLSYLAVFIISLKRRSIQRGLAFTERDFAQYFLIIAAVMFLFQFYLTLIELVALHAYCIICLGSQLCTLTLLIVAIRGYAASPKQE